MLLEYLSETLLSRNNYCLLHKLIDIKNHGIIFTIAYQTSAHSLSNFKQHMGQGELKLSKDTFELIEFYFSTGKYGAIYNNPKYDWQRKMIKSVWRPEFMIISKNGKGRFFESEAGVCPNIIWGWALKSDSRSN